MTRLLLVEADHTFRLRLVALLSGRFEVLVPPHGEDPLRLARATRPEVALIAAGERARGPALRLARVLKTDVRAIPALGLYTRPGEESPSAAAFASCGAEGFAGSVAEPEVLVAFLDALLRGEHPIPSPWPPVGPTRLSRLFRKLRA